MTKIERPFKLQTLELELQDPEDAGRTVKCTYSGSAFHFALDMLNVSVGYALWQNEDHSQEHHITLWSERSTKCIKTRSVKEVADVMIAAFLTEGADWPDLRKFINELLMEVE